jgi:hypothetical protein
MQLTDSEYAATAAKVARLNERAAKRGWTGRITIYREVVEKREWNDAIGLETVRYLNEVTISGAPPRYDGWTFLARLDWDPEAGLIVSTAPGAGPVDRSELAEGACDHCGRDIATRRHVFLVRHDDGRQLQVGSTCLKDFLGWDANPVWISAPSEKDLAEEGSGRGGAEERWGTETVLAASWACIKTFGWVSAGGYGDGVPTKHVVLDVLDPRTPRQRELAARIRPHIPDSAGQARLIRKYIASEQFTGDREYVTNLRAVARAQSCPAKNFGLLVSAPQAWARSVERDLRRQADNANRNNTWAGQVKDRIEITATVKAIRYQHGDYGTTTVYTLSGEDGRNYTWYSSAGSLGDKVTGQPVKLKGTIKKLEEYRGAKTTSLARCKVLDAEPVMPSAPSVAPASGEPIAPELEREAC